MAQTTVELNILDQNYSINCEVGEEMILKELSNEFNENINKLKIKHPGTSIEKLLVVYSLNLLKKFRNLKLSYNASEEYVRLITDKFPDSYE